MAHRNIRTLLDVSLAGMAVRVACRECAHAAVLDAGRLMWSYHRRGWSTQLSQLGEHVRCSSCGAREPTVKAVWAEPTVPARPRTRPQPVPDVAAPPGVDPETWARATPRERQRLANRVRG